MPYVSISRWYDFNQRGCVIITRIMNQDLVIWSGWFVPLPTLTLMIFARLLTHKDGIWLLSCKLAKRGKYCRRFLTLSSPPGNKVSWQGQVSDAGCHVMITIIRDIIMTSWHSSPHISYLRAPQKWETGSGKNFWSDLIYFSEICTFYHLLPNPHCHTKRFEIPPSSHRCSRDLGAFSSRAPGRCSRPRPALESSLWAHKHIIKGARARNADSVVAGWSQTQSRSNQNAARGMYLVYQPSSSSANQR